MTINKNSVEQINVALLDMDKKIKSAISNGISASDFKNLEASVDSIKRNLNETNAGLESGKTYNINISGNAATATKATTAATAETATNAETAITANHALTADTAETATTVTTANKVANALTVNGKTYDGSSAVDAGVQTVANGGTGVTTQADINKAFIGNLDVGESDVTDGTEFVSSYASDNGFNEQGYVNTPFRRKFSTVWNYIKGKISSGNIEANNLTLPATTSANLGAYGKDSLSIGFPSGTGDGVSLGFDRNSMQARANGSASVMYLNYYGGMVHVNETNKSDGGLKVKNKMVIPIGAPSSLEDGCIWIER